MGRDLGLPPMVKCQDYFNPRARMGRDALGLVYCYPCGFQSTRPHGARPGAHPGALPEAHFNPRARMGRDTSGSSCAFGEHISIHAPAWGATAYVGDGGI